ncbi:glycosyltransferase family 4 protein [Campylobacter vicugnae]|uniref:glycosyltransferase family 4 protein n=1 Tax=Campylobacter vicugnae TaxID=1660076 RepID=UPI0030CB2820
MPIKKWNEIKKRAVFKQTINEFNPDFIICHTHFDTSLTKIFKKCKIKLFKVIHNSFDAYEKWQINLNIYKNIVLLSNHDIDKFKTKYPNANFYIIPNFLPNISNLNTNYSQKVVVSVGRLSKEKGFLRLIDIWKLIQDSSEFKDWKLHIVGDGELKEKIENKIKDLNLTNSIILKPFTKDVESEYLSASIYAMTSHFEGLPMVLIEAQSYALPTISFDIATGPRDIIEDEKSGYLIKDNDLNEYATKLKTLMQDESLRAKMGAKSKEIVKSKFSKEVVMKQWMELFERLKNAK